MTHIHLTDPDVEAAVVDVLRQQPHVVIIERDTDNPTVFRTREPTPRASAEETPVPSPASPTPRAARTGPLTLREYVLNVLVLEERPLTTAEVVSAIRRLRGATNAHTVYNALYKAAKAHEIHHLADGTWARMPR